MNPHDIHSIINYGLFVHVLEKDVERGLRLYARGLTIFQHPTLLRSLGILQIWKMKNLNDITSAEYFKKANELDSSHRSFTTTQDSFFTYALILHPLDPFTWCQVALMHCKVYGEYDVAQTLFLRALRLAQRSNEHAFALKTILLVG